MAKKKKIQAMHVIIAIALLFVLSKIGVMNNLFAVTQDGVIVDVTCNTDADCPKPGCVGSYTLAERDSVQDCSLLNSTEELACELEDWWYNAQGDLEEVKCVEGVCETSPYCLFTYDDTKEWLKEHPFAWVKDNFGLALIALGLFVLLIFLLYTPEKK